MDSIFKYASHRLEVSRAVRGEGLAPGCWAEALPLVAGPVVAEVGAPALFAWIGEQPAAAAALAHLLANQPGLKDTVTERPYHSYFSSGQNQ